MLTGRTLSRAVDLAIIVLALAVTVQVSFQALDRVQPSARAAPPPTTSAPAQEYQIGERLPTTRAVDLSRTNHTLLLFLRSTCSYCTASMPFYAKVADARRQSPMSISLTALSSESERVLQDYLRRHNISLDATVSLSPADSRQYRVRGTPTIMLVDRAGIVRRVWIGQLAPEAEQEVLDLVSGRLAVP